MGAKDMSGPPETNLLEYIPDGLNCFYQQHVRLVKLDPRTRAPLPPARQRNVEGVCIVPEVVRGKMLRFAKTMPTGSVREGNTSAVQDIWFDLATQRYIIITAGGSMYEIVPQGSDSHGPADAVQRAARRDMGNVLDAES